MFAAESANIVAGCVTERKAQLLGWRETGGE